MKNTLTIDGRPVGKTFGFEDELDKAELISAMARAELRGIKNARAATEYEYRQMLEYLRNTIRYALSLVEVGVAKKIHESYQADAIRMQLNELNRTMGYPDDGNQA